MGKIKERPECREKINEIMKQAGAVTFEERHGFLRGVYFDSLDESDRPTKQRKYDKGISKQIEKMFDELHAVYMEVERDILKRKIHRKCSGCGKKHMVHIEDQRKHLNGEKVKFLCSTCRPPRKF